MQTQTGSENRNLMVRRVLRLGAASLVVGLATVAVAVLPASVASAATDTVTNCNGSASTADSLPYWVANAPSGDTIDFSVSCPPTSPIVLTSTINITKNLTINGLGPSDTAVSGNNAVGAFSVGSGVTDAMISGLTIEDGNSKYGGGIFNEGTLTVTDSTLSGNNAKPSCTSSCYANGGGIANTGTLTVTNSTLSGNSASTPICTACGAVGGGIEMGGTETIGATIVANTTSGGNCNGTVTTDLGYNLEDDAGASCGFSSTDHDVVGENPDLGPLQNNGGPTDTMALLPGSPAIDLVDSATLCATPDQRGIARPTPVCDSGAYETSTLFTSSTAGFTNPITDAVPSTICFVTVTADGGAGGANINSNDGAAGGSVTARIPVTPGAQFACASPL